MIRWYAIDATTGDRLFSLLSGDPVIFGAPDKWEAQSHIDKCFPALGLKARSVVEFDALRELVSAATRAKAWDDFLMARAKTWPVPSDPDDDEQGSLLDNVAFWMQVA